MSDQSQEIAQFLHAVETTICGTGRFRSCETLNADLGYVEVRFEGTNNKYALMWEPRDSYLEVYLLDRNGAPMRSLTQEIREGTLGPLEWGAPTHRIMSTLERTTDLVRRYFEA